MSRSLQRLLLTASCGLPMLAVAYGQSTLSLTSGSGSPGSSVSLPITLSVAQGNSVAALEWTLTYPTKDFTSVTIAAAGVATAAGKSIDCDSGLGTVTCLISGENDTALGSGTVATATLNISASAADTSAPLSLSSGSSASVAGEPVGTSTNGAIVSIALGTAGLKGLTCNPASVEGPASASCTVALTGNAPAGGLTASIGYTAGSGVVKSIPSVVTVQAATSSANFTASLNAVAAASIVDISARLNSSSATFNLQDNPAGGSSGPAPVVDAQVSHDQGWASTILYSPQLSTSHGNELILAFISTDYLSGNNTSVQAISGAGLTWTRVMQTNAQSGTAEIWRAFASQPLKNASFVATLSQSVVASMTVMSFSGVDPSGSNGSRAVGATGSGNGPYGAPSATLTTSRANSLIVGVGNDYDNPLARVPDAGQSLVHQWFSTTADTYWVQILNSPVASAGTQVTLGDTAPTSDRYNLSVCEVLAAPANGASRTLSGSAGPANNSAPAETAEVLK